MKKLFLAIPLLFFMIKIAHTQDLSLYTKHLFIQKNDTMPYRVLLPLNFDAHKRYPLILFLHGSGERGNDNEKQLIHGGDLFLKDSIRENYPALVVFPQCAAKGSWANTSSHYDSVAKKRIKEFRPDGKPTKDMALLLGLLKKLDHTYPLDKKKMYVGGLSMGGMGTFELVFRKPKTFATAFAICGGASTASAKKMRKTAWWIFHGLKDNTVDPQLSKDMADALKQAGAEVRLTLYPEDGHNSWDDAFKEPGLLEWIFSHHKK
jgi:predicted peptidase